MGRIGSFSRGVAAVVLVLAQLSDVVRAQQIDPQVLQRVQGQLGSGPNPGAQLDSAREQGADGLETGQVPGTGTLAPTIEELEVRRLRSRALLDELYMPSAVERDYQERLGDADVRLFGYDLFRQTSGGAGPLTGQVGDNYVLGVGDELVVTFQGATNDSRTARVDREGRLVVGQLAPVQAAGRTLGAVRSELSAATRRTLLGTDLFVSLGSVRAITIFVGGEVERPGQYQLTSLGDVATAIARAGGIRRTGSLRQVRVVRAGGATAVVDLYGLLGIGAPPAVRLQDGDRIVVPVIGPTAAIAGAVARPGIYELRGSTSLGALIDYAGGSLRARGYRIAVSRIAADGTETFARVGSEGDRVIAGDAVQIVGGSAGGTANRVMLRGFVENPGPRPLAAAGTVRELLGTLEDLKIGSYTPMAVLVRRDPSTTARVFEPVNLLAALRDSPSVSLRGDDQLYVFSQNDIEFINRPAVRRIVLGGTNPLPQCKSLERLRAIVQDSQSPRFSAAVRGAFAQRRGADEDDQGTQGVGGALTQNAGAVAIGGGFGARGSAGQVAGVGQQTEATARTPQIQPQQPQRLDRFGRPLASRNARQLDEQAEECARVFEDTPDLLPFLIENAVVVGGAVRRPAAYPVAGSIPASDLLTLTAGPLGLGSGAVLDVNRSPGSGQIERYDLAGSLDQLASVRIGAGDDIRVNAPQPQYEPGAVLLSGEFARPGLYSIRKGETLSQLISRAGGLTGQAYPYGAIFTRQRVREEQTAGLQRTAAELNAGLLAAVARRSSGGGEGLIAASGLIDRITSVEPIGRVTIEADPTVLSRRPDLDTVLEAGDSVFVPKRPNFILALGDLNNPGALQFTPGKSASAYITEAGGLSATADDDRVFLVLPDGRAQPIKGGVWSRTAAVIPPGSTIIVPKNIDPLKTLDLARDVTQIFSQVITSIASLAILATN